MENSRNNDELIRRKLNSYSVEPGKLSFDQVESKFKKTSSKAKWGFTSVIVSVITAIGIISYFIFCPSNTKTISTKNQTNQYNKNEIIVESKKTETSATNSANESQLNNFQHFENKEAKVGSNPENSLPGLISSNSQKNSETRENSKHHISGSAKQVSENGKNNSGNTIHQTSQNYEVNNETETGYRSTGSKKFKGSALTNKQKLKAKNNIKSKAKGNESDNTDSFKDISEEIAGNSSLKQSESVSNPESKTLNNDNTSETIASKGSEDLAFNYLQPKIYDFGLNIQANDQEVLVKDSFQYYTVKNKSKINLQLAAEVSYNTITPGISPNTSYIQPAQDTSYKGLSQYFPSSLAQAFTKNKYNLISGSASLGIKFKNFGLESGVGFLSLETKVSTKGMGYMTPVYVIDSILVDTFSNPIDTTYKIGYYKEKVIVNGDSTGAGEYLNNMRFFTIPLRFSYNFNLYRRKLWLEPMAGIQVTIPLNSYQLVAIKPSEFEYSKSKTSFRKKWIMYDLSAKLSYKFTPSASVYIRSGYTFGNSSVYNKDYPVKFTLRNLYTAFGVSINLN